ncbi:MAG: hypothetical protein J7K26_02260 [Candidatus Aenigmarchaeota archaeon]|nr:hypothetical protein [Candidatus Aenigmarchaeota archaeon]
MNKSINNKTFIFELKLVAIGLFITVFLQIIPSFLESTTVFGQVLTFDVMRSFFSLIGLPWFLVLIYGVYCLIGDKIKNNKLENFNLIFLMAFLLTLGYIVILITNYLIILIAIIT